MREKFVKNLGYLIVLIDICMYFILSYVFVDKVQVNIFPILINGMLLFVGTTIATNAMMKQGILIGRDTEKYKETLMSHLIQKQKIYPKLNKLQAWLDNDYAKLIKIGRSVYVNSAGYNYEQVFTEKGKVITSFRVERPEPIIFTKKQFFLIKPFLKLFRRLFSDDWKVYKDKKKHIKSAKKYRITRLIVSDLINVEADKDPNNFGKTESQYQKTQSRLDTSSKLVFSILLQSVSFGYNSFNITTFLTQMLNVVIIVLTSLFSMFNAYSFMIKTHRETIIKKINKMEEFDSSGYEQTKELEEKNKIDKEKQENGIHTEISVCTESPMVEAVDGHNGTGQTDDLCGNADIGV